MKNSKHKKIHCMRAWILSAALLVSNILGLGLANADAAGADVKLSKNSAALIIKKTNNDTKYGKIKVKMKKGNGVQIKKVVCQVKKKGLVTATVKGKNSPILNIKANKKGSTNIVISVRYKKKSKIRTKKLTFKVKVVLKDTRTKTTSRPETTSKPEIIQQPEVTSQPTEDSMVSESPTDMPIIATEEPTQTPVSEIPSPAPSIEDEGVGLFDSQTGELLKSWKELIDENDLIFEDTGTVVGGNNELSGKLVLSNEVTALGEDAFSGCDKLTDIVISENVTSIGENAFQGCSGLAELFVPESVSSIGENAFYQVPLVIYDGVAEGYPWGAIKVKGKNSPKESGLYAVEGARLMSWDELVEKGSIRLSEDGKSILSADKSLSGVLVIEDGITEISVNNFNGDCYGFDGCAGLTGIEMPNSIDIIGCSAFKDCKNLKDIRIPDSVTVIGSNAFIGCKNLKNIEIPYGVKTIGSRAFEGCTGLTEMEIPKSVTSIGYAPDLNGEEHLYTWYLGSVFSECTNLKKITVEEGNEIYDSRDNCNAVIASKTNTLVAACDRTIIPDSVTVIGDYAFDGCTGLTGIEIPESVTSIGSRAFYGCSKLENLQIPEGVSEIKGYTFYKCSSLQEIHIPKSITEIDFRAIGDCGSLERLSVAEDNPVYDSRENCNAIIETRTNKLLYGCMNTVIPDSVVSIGEKAFENCIRLKEIEIPESVISIGDEAFQNCIGIEEIWLPNGMEAISADLFYGCSNLTSVHLPDSIKDIGWGAFFGCSQLTDISIPDGVVKIHDFAFANCSSLIDIEIPDNVGVIGEKAFIEVPHIYYYGSASGSPWGALMIN